MVSVPVKRKCATSVRKPGRRRRCPRCAGHSFSSGRKNDPEHEQRDHGVQHHPARLRAEREGDVRRRWSVEGAVGRERGLLGGGRGRAARRAPSPGPGRASGPPGRSRRAHRRAGTRCARRSRRRGTGGSSGHEVAAVGELRIGVQVAEVLDRHRLDADGLERPRPRRSPGRSSRTPRVAARDVESETRSSSVHAATATQRSPTLAVVGARARTSWQTARSRRVARARPRVTPVRLVLEQPRGEREDRGLDLRHVEVDAAPGATPVQQPGGERGRDEARRERVGDRAVRADGLAVGPAGEEVVARRAPSPGRRSRGSRGAGRSGR